MRPARMVLGLATLTLTACAAVAAAGDGTSNAPLATTRPATVGTPAPTSTTARPRAVVVGLGDSVTAGTNCGCTDFITQYAAQLPALDGGPAIATNDGTPGLTTDGLVQNLTSDGPTRAAVAGSTIVIITIGANDLGPLLATWQANGCSVTCYQPAVTTMGQGVRRVLALVDGLRAGRPTTLLVTDYWNVFQDGDVARNLYGSPTCRGPMP